MMCYKITIINKYWIR